MGKMISPQNLSVGAAGVNRVGAEGEIFRRTIGYSLILTAAVGIVAMIEAYLIPGIIPASTPEATSGFTLEQWHSLGGLPLAATRIRLAP